MPYNGSGVFTLYSPGNPVVTGTTISSTWANNTFSDIANNGLSSAITKDGQTTVTANIPMSGFKFTGLGAGTAGGDSARLSQVQGGAAQLLTGAAGTNTITAGLSPTLTAYATGQSFILFPAVTNTGAATINIDGLGAKNIYSQGKALIGGELRASIPARIVYDGTQFEIVGNANQAAVRDVSEFIPMGTVTATTDCTSYFTAALAACSSVRADGGTYRIDGTVTIDDGKSLYLTGGAALKRLSGYSASTAVVVHLKGTKASFLGDGTCSVWSENKSPGGVVCLGHLDTTTSNWNSLWWLFKGIHVYCKDFRADYATKAVTGITKANPAVVTASGHGYSNGDPVQLRSVGGMVEVNDNVYTAANVTANTFELSGTNSSSYTAYTSGGIAQLYPALTDGVGVYVPSSQPQLGSSYANYYGTLEDITVHNATIPYWFTDSSNAHQLQNTRFEFTYHYGYRFNGSYGNSGTVGFCNGAYKNGVITFFFGPKLAPGAPYAPSHESTRNLLYAGAVELYTTGNYGAYFNNANCVANTVVFQWNSTGTQYSDVTGTSAGTLNTVMTYTQNNIPYITSLELVAGTQVSTPIIRSPSTSYPQSISILPKFSGAGTEYGVVFSGGAEVYPNVDNTSNLGKSSFRWATVYAATGTINTSDENEKDSIKPIDDAALRAWGRVQYSQFKFRDAVAKKGDGARWHFGLVAQRVKEAFEAEGLNAFEYGLLCFDEWPDQEEVRDEEGRVVVPACKAGSRFGVRYEEALALECAYLRSQLGKL